MARWKEQLKGLVVLKRHRLALREELEHLSAKTRSFGCSDGGQDEHAEDSARLSEADLPGVKKKSWRSRRQRKRWNSYKGSTS